MNSKQIAAIAAILFLTTTVSKAQEIASSHSFGFKVKGDFITGSQSNINSYLQSHGYAKTDNLASNINISFYAALKRSVITVTYGFSEREANKEGGIATSADGWNIGASYGYELLPLKERSSLMPYIGAGYASGKIKYGRNSLKKETYYTTVGIDYLWTFWRIGDTGMKVSLGPDAGILLNLKPVRWEPAIGKESIARFYAGIAFGLSFN